jgi:hypothetical protein
MLLEDTRGLQLEACVQRGLPAETEQDGVDAFLDDDLLDEMRVLGEINGIGVLLRGLDRGVFGLTSTV